ncbi:MAG: hypothetical protein R2712_24840 [Vicinamibacterales bacterium]
MVGVQNPYAEVDYKTSGGHDSYNALQLSLQRRLSQGLTLNAQYTLARSFGNTAGSNEAQTAANNARAIADFDYDLGYNAFDVRHMFNVSALYSVPFGHGRAHGAGIGPLANLLAGGWDVGAIVNGRSGLPVDVKIVRPDVVYEDQGGNYFLNPAAGRVAVINTPGGGASRNVRRPDLVPRRRPHHLLGHWRGLPEPGRLLHACASTFGNLRQRGSIKGLGSTRWTSCCRSGSRMPTGQRTEFRWEIFQPVPRPRQLQQPGWRRCRRRCPRPALAKPTRYARSALLCWRGGHVRHPHQHRRSDGRPRHAAADAVRPALRVLDRARPPVCPACRYAGCDAPHGRICRRMTNRADDADSGNGRPRYPLRRGPPPICAICAIRGPDAGRSAFFTP